jgi:hypothetical protein
MMSGLSWAMHAHVFWGAGGHVHRIYHSRIVMSCIIVGLKSVEYLVYNIVMLGHEDAFHVWVSACRE